jgi:hypothetical protein
MRFLTDKLRTGNELGRIARGQRDFLLEKPVPRENPGHRLKGKKEIT